MLSRTRASVAYYGTIPCGGAIVIKINCFCHSYLIAMNAFVIPDFNCYSSYTISVTVNYKVMAIENYDNV